jgi:hypothetical protein
MGSDDLGIEAARRRDWTADDGRGGGTTAPGTGPTSRAALEATAYEKLKAWILGCNGYGKSRDYDRCGTDPIKVPSTLFLQENGDCDEVDANDVQQHHLGDCYFMAALAGMAATPAGRAAIHGAITQHTDADGTLVYSVKLYEAQAHLIGPKTFTERTIDVRADDPYVLGHAVAREQDGQYEVWPLVMEKAYAKLHGSYNAIAKGGYVDEAMETLTGKEAAHVKLGSHDGYSFEQLWSDVAAQKAVVLSTKGGIANGTGPNNPYTLVEHHAYVVTGVEQRDGKSFVLLHNPWNDGDEHHTPKPVPYEELRNWFHAADTATPASAP